MGRRLLVSAIRIACVGAWLAGGAAAFGQAAPAQATNLATRKVPEKELPVPGTLSPELAAFVAMPIRQLPLPKTNDEWKAAQKALDGPRGEQAEQLAAKLGAKIEDTTVAGVRCFRVTPKAVATGRERRLLVHVHGGAYVLGAGRAALMEAVLVADAAKTPVLSVDYRMPPDHPYPAAVDDAVAVWTELARDHDPARLALFGTSTGGGLTMATVLKLKDLKRPLPGAIFLGTPWTDLTKTGDSYFLNAEIDNVLGRYEGFLSASALLYAGKTPLNDPYLSPVYGDVSGFPPTILISGTRDLFLSITVRAHRKLRAAGVTAELHVFEGQSHGDYLRSYPAPESVEALREVAAFFDKYLGR